MVWLVSGIISWVREATLGLKRGDGKGWCVAREFMKVMNFTQLWTISGPERSATKIQLCLQKLCAVLFAFLESLCFFKALECVHWGPKGSLDSQQALQRGIWEDNRIEPPAEVDLLMLFKTLSWGALAGKKATFHFDVAAEKQKPSS